MRSTAATPGARVVETDQLLEIDPAPGAADADADVDAQAVADVEAHVLDVAGRVLSLDEAEHVTVRVDRDEHGPLIRVRGPAELVDRLEAALEADGDEGDEGEDAGDETTAGPVP